MQKYKRPDGRLVTADEALDENGILKDGYSISIPVMFRDDQLSLNDHGQGEYERNLANRWRGGQQQDSIPHGVEQSQAHYENRVSNAWRAGK